MTLKWSIDQANGKLAFGRLVPMAGGTYDISISGQTAGTTYVFYVMDEDATHCLARSTCTNGAYSIAFTQEELRRNFEKHWHEVRTFHTVASDGTNTIAEGDLAIQWNPVWTEPESGNAYSMKGPQGPQGPKGDDGEDGDDGADGEDGHSPVVTATKEGKTTSLKVDGVVVSSINDGEDGADGEDGEDGADGAPGVPASVVQIMNPATGKWHYLYARMNANNNFVLSMDQDESERDMAYIVPPGGTGGQVLTKNSSTDYDVRWANGFAMDDIPTEGSANAAKSGGILSFVNSSVATNTANYISNNGQPFTSVAELNAYTGTVTNNDYAFVTGTDNHGNTYYDRYKATVSGGTRTWSKEYRLNNSSFTAAQWAAISSGLTSSDKSSIASHESRLTTLEGLIEALYPIGSIYIGTQDSCPLATLIPGSTWTQITGRYLLASGTLFNVNENYTAGESVSAGLPDIVGSLTSRSSETSGVSGALFGVSGAFNVTEKTTESNCYTVQVNQTPGIKGDTLTFDAASSSSIYGNSATVRPPAYVVNVWRRTH